MTTVRDNVDPAEVAKFDALASRWWDPEGEFRPLHEINPLRLDWIRRHVTLADAKIVDIGCGGGILAEAMAAANAMVTGIDMAEGPLAVARLHQHESDAQIDYRQATAEELAAAEAGKYDVVTCLEMLEHVPDPASIIISASRLLKPDGVLFLSTINRNPKSFALAILGAEYILRMLPRGTHEYKKFIKPSEMATQLRACGMRVSDTSGMTFNPLRKHYSLGRDIDVNYLLTARFED